MRFHIRISLLLLLGLILGGTASRGQTYHFRTREASQLRSATQIKAHNGFPDTLIVRQDKWDEMVANGSGWTGNLKFKSVHAFVKFSINHAYPVKIAQPYTFRLTYQVYGYGNMSDTSSLSYFGNDTLTVTYKPDSLAAFQDLQYKKYSNLHKVMIVLTGLYQITDATSPPVAQNLSSGGPFDRLNFNVEASILVQPFHKKVKVGGSYVNAYGNTAPELATGADAVADDYLPVRWNLSGVSPLSTNLSFTPVNYELEWTYIDNYAVNPSTGIISTVPASALQYNFKDNATRIWLDTNYYRIPLIYQKGYLVYRVRAVRPDSVQFRYPIYGPWTLADAGTVSAAPSGSKYEISQAHLSDSLNWQYTVSFAEQGKYKHVMSYYDGMLKNRQSITRFNSMPGKLIATEQVYDYEGRPSISLLPTPVTSGAFRYQFNLTLNEATALPYKAADFDAIQTGICPLDIVPSRLADASPAQQYYSPSNPDQAGFQKFVPDAGGYPFVQTIYSPGYDERVEKQGGAGDTLQIGYNHNVKNDYVNADQMDLNRLFGIDIGWSGFYRKTVSRDPNGQLSLNVTDYKGKTMTSSMLGIPDTSLHAIVPNENLPDTSFYYEEHIAGTSQQIIGNKRILDKNFFNDAAGNNQSQYIYSFTPYPTFCPGKYLSVKARYDYSIFDECGTLKVDTGGTLGTTGVLTAGTLLADTSEQVSFYMEKGKHSLHKELTINYDDVHQAVDEFMALSPAENCLRTEQSFIKESVLSREFPCPEDYINMDCGTCDGKKYQMMQELWPNKDSLYTVRKYGVYQRVSDSVIGNNNSIFTIIADTIPSGVPEIPPTIIVKGYRYQDTCLVHLPASVTRFGHTYTNLQSLPVDTFIYIFNDSIAEALLPLHPEYCKLLECVDDKFEERLRSIPDASVAEQLGLMRLSDIIAADPVYLEMLNAPGDFPSPYDTLAFTFGGSASLDTLALLHAYCNSQDSVMMALCRTEMFQTQIYGNILANDYVKARYFELIRAAYLSNRARYLYLLNPLSALGSCATCSDVRMELVPPPVFPEWTTPGGGLATGPGSVLGTLQLTDPGSGDLLTDYYNLLSTVDLDTLAPLNDSAYNTYMSSNTLLCEGAVDQIIAQLVNCADSVTLLAVKDDLLALCAGGQVAYGNYSPQQIRSALTDNGIALDDLCNPYLINYDNTMVPSQSISANAGFLCRDEAFYADLTTTLNTSHVISRLKNPNGSATGMTLSTGNQFQAEIAGILGTTSITVSATYNLSKRLYKLAFMIKGDTVKLYVKAAANGACALPFQIGTGETLNITASCINNTSFSNLAGGYVGKYAVAITSSRTSGGVTTNCLLPAWCDRIEMRKEGNNPIRDCVPCTQMRSLYTELSDTLTAYQVKGADHPYYNTMLRNFLNYKLQKAFTWDQYRTFMESCALADSMQIMRYVGYLNITFLNGSYAQDFLDSLNNFDSSVSIMVNYRLRTMYGEQLAIDINQVPKHKLRKVIDFFNTYDMGGISQKLVNLIDNTSDFRGYLWLPDTTTFDPSTAIPGLTFTQNPADIDYWNGASFEPYKLMQVYAPSGSSLADNNYNVALLQQYLYEQGIVQNFYPCVLTTVNDQYHLQDKKDYLHYTYNYQGQPPGKVLDSLQTPYLKAGISAFNGQMLRYGHPAAPGNITNLYYADSSTAAVGTQYAKLSYIIGQVKNTLGNNALFFSGNNTRNISVPSGELLTAYRCRDTAFWYRYFGPGDTLYNVFIRVPAYLDTGVIAGYQLDDMTFNLGEGDSRSFRVKLYNPAAPVQYISLDGYTDFTVARNQVLRDVLLAYPLTNTPPAPDTVHNCERNLLEAAVYEGRVRYRLYIDSVRDWLTNDFYTYIMGPGIQEQLFVGYRNQRFNYTLYYYDRAGNLMRTVPPAGVSYVPNSLLNGVNSERSSAGNNSQYLPAHHKESEYYYNTLNQVAEQETPDGGRTEYFYDAAGRAIFSQNAQQRLTGRMTYTLYDRQGRIAETGQAALACPHYFEPFKSPTNISSYPCSYYVNGTLTPFPPVVADLGSYSHEEVAAYVRSLTREEVVLTHYDTAALNLGAATGMSTQDNLRKRVSAIKYFDYLQPADTSFSGYNYAMHFSYDIAGNVKTLTRDYPAWKREGQQFKRVDYDYDVISGKVNLLSYNRSFADQYFQRYNYDGDNRIVTVETSADGYIWKRDAAYEYYQHGPLARMSLGDLRVQGTDFAYTIQGWLKAVNGDLLDVTKDMGGDAAGNSVHARDAVALSLDYFKGDYRPIGGTAVTHVADPERNMYNGNIPRATTAIAPFPTLNTRYIYDQLNRIVKAQYAYVNPYDAGMTNTADYYSKYAYDPDGNLQQLVRNGNAVGGSSQLMDSLEYHYQPGGMNNRLQNVTDYVSNTFHNDIKHYTNTGASRYLYDATGNTIKDLVSGQDTIQWNHYNKVMLTRRDSLGNNLSFAYDGAGQRYLKNVVRELADTTLERSDYYVRDAQGNILAVYDAESRYEMNRQEWVEYITEYLAQSAGVHEFSEHIAQHYVPVGQFSNELLSAIQAEPTFTAAATAAAPVSFYVQHDQAIKTSMVYAGTADYPSLYAALKTYYDNTHIPLLGAGLYNYLSTGPENLQEFLVTAMDEGMDSEVKLHLLEVLCQQADTVVRSYIERQGGTYDTVSCAGNAAILTEYIGTIGLPDVAYELSQSLALLPAREYQFLEALSLDNTIQSYEGYVDPGAPGGGTLIPYFQESLMKHTSDTLLGSFLDTWAPADDLLRTAKPEDLLPVVYAHAPAALIEAYVNSLSGETMPVANSLAQIPWLSPRDLLSDWNPLIITDSVIHTIYENVLHSRRLSLSEHHLYGSSRLGTKEYLPGEYYQLWDYSAAPAIADTLTLGTRKPWYSLEYNDDISGLVQQPWGMTDVSAFQAGHTLGQKQYELSNHLGNVQATLSDYPSYHASGTGDTIREHNPALVTAYDYYPFGMLMPGRGTDSLNAISNVQGNILVLSTDFSDGTHQGWAPGNGTSIENGRMKVSVQGPWYGTSRDMVLTPGKQYRARVNYDASTMITAGPTYLAAINGNNGSTLAATGMFSSGTGYEINFTAPSASFVRFSITTPNTTPTGINVVYYIDNFTLEEIVPQPEVPPVTNGGCVTMSQAKWVTTLVDSCYYVSDWTWPNYDHATFTGTAPTGTVSNTGHAIEANIPTANEYISFGFFGVPGTAQSIDLEFSDVFSGTPVVQVLEDIGGNWQVLTTQSISTKGTYTLNFVPSRNDFRVRIPGPYYAAMRKICVKKPALKQEHVLVTICPEDKDRYRFGFNGQEKVNEWAGMGNYNEFKERGYDTRIGRFLRVDPMSGQYPWNSTYAFAENRPIDGMDYEGKEWYRAVKQWFVNNGTIAGMAISTANTVDAAYNGDKMAQVALVSGVGATVIQGVDVYTNGTSVQKEEFTTLLVLDIAAMFVVPTVAEISKGTFRASSVAKSSVTLSEKPVVTKTFPVSQVTEVKSASILANDNITIDKQGFKTNGKYRVDATGQEPHTSGDYTTDKSQFKFGIDADKAILDAAKFADENNLWQGNKAKVYVKDGVVGYSNGQPTQWVNIYRTDKGMIHGAPTSTPGNTTTSGGGTSVPKVPKKSSNPSSQIRR